MKAFLHIGTEKTGTTTIQSFLAKNRSCLLRDGFLYPKSPGETNHIKLVAFSLNLNDLEDVKKHLHGLDYLSILNPEKIDDFRKTFQQDLEKETSSAEAQTVILSSEHCSSRLIRIEEINILKSLLKNFFEEIKIIIYLRRQDQLLLSSYSTQVICDGRTQPLDMPNKQVIERYYDYQAILKKWGQVFGQENIIIRPFERKQMIKDDLLYDFARVIGFTIDNDYEMVPNLNESYSIESLEFLRNMNFHIARYAGNRLNPERRKLFHYLKAYTGHSYSLLSEEDRREFLDRFKVSNTYISKHYLNSGEEQLFKEEVLNSDADIFSEFEVERVFEIFAYLWRQQYQEVCSLERENQRLARELNKLSRFKKLFYILNPRLWLSRLIGLFKS